MTRPITPTANDAAISGKNQSQNDVSALENPERADRGAAAETLLEIEGKVAAEQVERPVRHVDDAHQPEDERESARDDEEEARERETQEQDAEEDPGLLDEGLVREGRGPRAPRTARAPRWRSWTTIRVGGVARSRSCHGSWVAAACVC